MPYTREYTDCDIENVQIYKVMADNGNFLGLSMSGNFTLTNNDGDSIGLHIDWALTTQQKIQVLNFLKSFVVNAAENWDVNPPDWAKD